MGQGQGKYEVSTRIRQRAITHENRTTLLNRTQSLSSYERDEKLSLGKGDVNIFSKRLNDELLLTNKGSGYVDAERKRYANIIDVPECCLTSLEQINKNGVIFTCDPITKDLDSSSACDSILLSNCLQSLTAGKEVNSNCNKWIKGVVKNNKSFLNDISYILSKEEIRNHPLVITFINSLREYNSSTNNYNKISDTIINSYSQQIKKNEYKCAYPSEEIIESENKEGIAKECWYKECVLSPEYKLLTENIFKRKECAFTICDINIKNIQIGNNDIQIICKNQYNRNNKFDIKDNPINQDLKMLTPFFIPDHKNITIPFLITLFILFLGIKN